MAGDFGELLLVIGDFHIPHRASFIPEKFQKLLVPNKIQRNIVTKEHYDELRRLAPSGNVHIVKGIYDEEYFPESKTIQIGQFKIGLINGYQVVPCGDPYSLSMMQRQLDADILISGHTHKSEINEHNGKWFLNPGSVTGASSILNTDVVPSFVLLAIQGPKVVSYIYELHGNQVDVLKSEFAKK